MQRQKNATNSTAEKTQRMQLQKNATAVKIQ